ncbi:hypothetical protein VP424E501_P0227 [Vibrio phage 424E50-1]|nr:hypothetical protein VP424E501_P0227 [Vibrio phage 424E50-1]
MNRELKSYTCTVADKRGFQGKCMEEASDGDFVLKSDVEKLLVRLDKHHRRCIDGNAKLITNLNTGKTLLLTEDIIRSLTDKGFKLEVTDPPPYQGNLPVEERIQYFSVKLKGGVVCH